MKILAIQFRYLGDAVLMTPALRAIKEHFANASLHVLVAQEIVPVLQHVPWIDRVWAFPRERGRKTILKALPVIHALRRERFDRSVDFAGNDRGALLSRLCGARQRLGPLLPGGFLGRRRCYTQTIPPVCEQHEVIRNLRILAAWGIAEPDSPQLEIRADPTKAAIGEEILPRGAILCHLSTSQPKKEWPLAHWTELHRQASAAGYEVFFSSGIATREASLLEQFQKLAPKAPTLPAVPDLAQFIAVLKNARLFIGADSAVLHITAALGVPTISLFGPSFARVWAPLGPQHRILEVEACACRRNDTAVCLRQSPCLESISPENVMRLVSLMTSELADPGVDDAARFVERE